MGLQAFFEDESNFFKWVVIGSKKTTPKSRFKVWRWRYRSEDLVGVLGRAHCVANGRACKTASKWLEVGVEAFHDRTCVKTKACCSQVGVLSARGSTNTEFSEGQFPAGGGVEHPQSGEGADGVAQRHLLAVLQSVLECANDTVHQRLPQFFLMFPKIEAVFDDLGHGVDEREIGGVGACRRGGEGDGRNVVAEEGVIAGKEGHGGSLGKGG